MRGHRKHNSYVEVRLGSIPADAGAPPTSRTRKIGWRVYPRGCGGTDNEPDRPSPLPGLSPRMRGHPVTNNNDLVPWRSIPADAGAPDGAARGHPGDAVYPRGCGGTGATSKIDCCFWGLSPRMRGHPTTVILHDGSERSIPADAGAPPRRPDRMEQSTVYPRGCGGTPASCWQPAMQRGLSPRMRGHPLKERDPWKWTGSIPADAGAPAPGECSRRSSGVYPRGCGGTPAPVCQEPGATGPSLRVSRRTRDSLSQGQSAFLNVWVRSGKCNSVADSVRFAFVSEKITVNRPGVDVVIRPPLSLPTSGPVPHG